MDEPKNRFRARKETQILKDAQINEDKPEAP